MKIIKTALVVFVCLLFQFCKPQDSPAEADFTTVETEVRQTLENYYADIRKSGLLAEFNYLDSTADFFWVPPGYHSPLNFDSVATILKQNAPFIKSIDNSFTSLKIITLSLDLASYSGVIRSVCTDTSGHVSTSSLIESGLLIRRKNGWKLLNGQTSLLKGE